jgi:hypothetical protein
VSAGDRPSYDSVHVLRVEGVTAVDAFRPTAAAEYRAATVTVPVADGRLTVDAVGGTNTKLNYADVARVTDETVPPAAPAGLSAVAGDRQVALAWTANPETDLLGYRVRRGGTVVSGAGLVTTPSWTDTTVANGATQSYQVTAVDRVLRHDDHARRGSGTGASRFVTGPATHLSAAGVVRDVLLAP